MNPGPTDNFVPLPVKKLNVFFSEINFEKIVGDLGKLIDAKGFKKLPQSGHTGLSE